MSQIQFKRLLSLSEDDISLGNVVTVRLKERDDDPIASYCADETAFHKKYFPYEGCSLLAQGGVSFCLLEIAQGLWLLTKAVRKKDGGIEEAFNEFAGRLLISFHKKNHSGNINLRTQINRLMVHSILERPYSFLWFDGYNQVRLKFGELKRVVKSNLSDWRKALQSVFGVYLITDTKRGGAYVGSAYGKEGLWGRWGCYASDDFHGHGGDKGLIERIGENKDYPENFEFSILEVINKNASEKDVRKRESWWKDTLRTRKNHKNNGMNEN